MAVRKDTWILIAVLAIGVPAAVITAIVSFNTIASAPIHSDAGRVPSVTRSTPDPQWSEAVEQARQTIRAAIVEQNLPGVSVAVGTAGQVVWAEGFGFANVTDHTPVSPEMAFRIGHASKPITSAAVGLLLERGRLDLDAPIQKYVPTFPAKAWPVTLRHLMAHTAGVRHYRDTEWGDRPAEHCDRASLGLKTFQDDPLLFEPGSEYRYSTYGWVLVSAAVEAVSNETFFEFVRREISAPIGMTNTGPDSVEARPDRATPYYQPFKGLTVVDNDYSCFAGAGGLTSTPSDLVRFGVAIGGGKILRSETVKMLQTPQVLTSGKETDYGLGWMLETIPVAGVPTRMAGHGARTVLGGTTSLLTFPGRGLVVTVMTNKAFADTKSVALAIAQRFAK